MIRLAMTVVEHLPSWDSSRQALVNPNFWEKQWWAVYDLMGAVANTNQQLLESLKQTPQLPHSPAQDKPQPVLKNHF